MSTRIAASLTLDNSGFDAGITKAEASANKFSSRLRAQGVGLFTGKSARQSASAIGEIMTAQEKLTDFRRRAAFQEAGPLQKIRMVTAELRDLAAERARTEAGTAPHLRAQLAIEEKLASLRGLQRGWQSMQLAGGGGLAGAAAASGGMMAMVRRKFGLDDALKDSLRTFGLGGIGAIATTISNHFRRQTSKAEGEWATNRALADIQIGAGAEVGGMESKLRAIQSRSKGVNAELSITKNTLRDLESSPLDLFVPGHQEMVESQRELVNKLSIEQAQLSAEERRTKREIKEQNEALARQEDHLRRVNALTARRARPVELAREEHRAALAEVRAAIEGKRGPTAVRQAQLASLEAQGQLDAMRMGDNRQQRATRIGVGELVAARAAGRVGRRTETERLAAQAARYEAQSEQALVEGNAPRFNRLAQLAREQFTDVGRRIEGAGQGGPRGEGLNSQLIQANELLRDIREALRAVDL